MYVQYQVQKAKTLESKLILRKIQEREDNFQHDLTTLLNKLLIATPAQSLNPNNPGNNPNNLNNLDNEITTTVVKSSLLTDFQDIQVTSPISHQESDPSPLELASSPTPQMKEILKQLTISTQSVKRAHEVYIYMYILT